MTAKYNTAHFVVGETTPETEPQKSLADIVFMVKERLAHALSNDSVGLAGTHPRVIISMVVTNILVNLLYNSIGVRDLKIRRDMVIDCLTEIEDMTMELWNALEANRADMSNAH